MNFKKNFKRKVNFTADFKWIKSVDDETTDYRESVDEGPDSLQRSINFADEINWLFQADYSHPFGNEVNSRQVLKQPHVLLTMITDWIRKTQFL